MKSEELAKRWLLELIERTPAESLEELPLSWIVREAPGMVESVAGEIEQALSASFARQSRNGGGRDALTGLYGPGELEKWLESLIAGQRRYGHPVAVLGIDVIGLRHINESKGPNAGDAVLASIGGLLRDQIRSVDKAFRLREDEFCVLAAEQEAEQVRPLAERILRSIETAHAGSDPHIAVSIGIASCPHHGDEARSLLGRATEARYAAKASGKSVAVAR